jgi:hypothetical protein
MGQPLLQSQVPEGMAYMAFSRLFRGTHNRSRGGAGLSPSRLKPLISCDIGSTRRHFVRRSDDGSAQNFFS